MKLQQQFEQHAQQSLGESVRIPENLISDEVVQIENSDYQIMLRTIEAFEKLRANKTYISFVEKSHPISEFDPKNYAIMMSYDFHVNKDGVKLIEINTNAAFSHVVDWLYQIKNIPTLYEKENFVEQLKKDIFQELQFFGNKPSIQNIGILDDEPKKQAAYFDFLFFKKAFQKLGWETFIGDPRDFQFDGKALTFDGQPVDFVYNRCCDFLFEDPKNSHLKEAYLKKASLFSPNPHEYNLLANKQRLIDITVPGFLESIKLEPKFIDCFNQVIPKTIELNESNSKVIWNSKKQYFFKPKNLFGSKAVYRGSSISHKKFNSLIDQNFLAQEFVAPGIHDEFKFDLRIYTYRNNPYFIVSRLYKGQVTNLRTPDGGLGFVSIL